jgi:hypothetical protein
MSLNLPTDPSPKFSSSQLGKRPVREDSPPSARSFVKKEEENPIGKKRRGRPPKRRVIKSESSEEEEEEDSFEDSESYSYEENEYSLDNYKKYPRMKDEEEEEDGELDDEALQSLRDFTRGNGSTVKSQDFKVKLSFKHCN